MKSAKTVHKFVARVYFVGLRPPSRRSVVDRYSRKVVFDTWYQAWEFLNDFCPGDLVHSTDGIDYFVETVSLTLSLDPPLWFLTDALFVEGGSFTPIKSGEFEVVSDGT